MRAPMKSFRVWLNEISLSGGLEIPAPAKFPRGLGKSLKVNDEESRIIHLVLPIKILGALESEGSETTRGVAERARETMGGGPVSLVMVSNSELYDLEKDAHGMLYRPSLAGVAERLLRAVETAKKMSLS